MRSKTVPLVVLVAALSALVFSVGWAVARSSDSNGSGMMRRYGSGMMGYTPASREERVRDLAGAKRQAQHFANRLGLRVGEVMHFSNNYYAELREKNGKLATEVLVEPSNGSVYLEYGPAMMWNTRYGMMSDYRMRGAGGMMRGGMMGGSGGGMMGAAPADPTWTPGTSEVEVTPIQARRLAQRWLENQSSHLTAAEPDVFPGYYTLHVLRNGNIAGMISVNAATGAVWSHWWHGRFISMLEG